MKRVIIIDDAFCDSELLRCFTEAVYEINDSYEVSKIDFEKMEISNDYLSHADICAKIIKKYCKEVKFINIVIKDTFKNGDVNKLIKAIDYSCSLDGDAVHMSVGTTCWTYSHKMHKAVSRLALHTKIIAAQANNGKITFPAFFPEVNGCKHESVNEIRALGRNNYALSGKHLIRDINRKPFFVGPSNSFAAAYYTGLYCSGKVLV